MGDGFSIAWRTFDAQYWGVPQRRRRIYLVADFAGERARKILFERDGLRGYPAQGKKARKETSGNSGGSADGNCQMQRVNTKDNVVYPTIARTLTAEGSDASPCVDRGQNIVVYDGRGNGNGNTAATLTGDHENRVTDYSNVVCMATGQANAEVTENLSPTLNCNHEQPIVAGTYQNTGIGWWNEAHVAGTLRTPAGGDSTKSNLVVMRKPPRRYIVRRLTPLECCRLQGFPDGWGEIEHKDSFTDEEAAFWQGVRATHAAITGGRYTPCGRDTLLKWYNSLHTDSAEYRMWGNGIALPCARYVMVDYSQ